MNNLRLFIVFEVNNSNALSNVSTNIINTSKCLTFKIKKFDITF